MEMENDNQTNNKEPQQATDKVQEAIRASERLEAANKQLAENIAKMERLKAEAIVSGKSEGGQKPKTQKQKDQEEANAVLERMGYQGVQI